jgi:hypothetical protein
MRAETKRFFVSATLAAALAFSGCGGAGGSGQTEPPVEAEAEAGVGSQKGDEGRLQEVGGEAVGRTRSAMVSAERGYLRAVGRGDARSACSYLSKPVRSQLRELAAGRSNSPGCGESLPALLSSTAAQVARRQARGHISHVRVSGNRGYVIFHAPGAVLYVISMRREEGGWKVATVGSSVLVPSRSTLGVTE